MTEADLNEIGMLAVDAQVRGNLANRLRVTEWHRTHPELAGAPVEAPLILVGMPRSGTTALSHLLAADPDNRSLLAWEANESIPPPTTATYQDDPRFEAARAAPSAVALINPGFKAIHHDEPDDAMECTVLHAQHFQSLIYSTDVQPAGLRRVVADVGLGRRRPVSPARPAGPAVRVPGAVAAEVAPVRAAARLGVRHLPGRRA